MKRLLFSGLMLAMIAACETVPPPPVEMDAAAFDAALAEAKDESHPYLTIESLSETLESQTLSDQQEIRLRFERGSARRLARIDLPGALADFNAALALVPEGQTNANLDTEIEYTNTDLQRTEARLRDLQTLPQWFDDMVAKGELATAAERFRASGLAPAEDDARLLQAAGYLCKGGSSRGDRWPLGEELDHLDELEWCEKPAVS